MFLRRSKRWLTANCAVAAAATALVLVPGPAQAADYNIGGKVPGYSGSGHSHGTVAFYSNLKKFTWIGEVRDECAANGDGDGKGMEVRIRIRYRNGTYGWENNVLQDLNGCGSTWEYVNFPQPYVKSLNIDALQVQLWATEGGTPFVVVDTSTWKTNPN